MAEPKGRGTRSPRTGSPDGPQVVVIGAGIAGLTASLRLLQRGFHVTLIEQDKFMGGMLRAAHYDDDTTGDRHEHSYHMVLNWYHNLWDIIDELGLRGNLTPANGFAFIHEGQPPTHMHNVGSPTEFLRNVLSGAAPPPELFLFMYSLVDLLSQRIDTDEFLDEYSANEFLRSRPYATETTAMLHQKVWETVWAIPSYQASAKSYQTFLKFGNFEPMPGMWLFNTDKHTALIDPIEKALRAFGDKFTFMGLTVVDELVLDDRGVLTEIRYHTVDRSPSVPHDKDKKPKSTGEGVLPVHGDVIVATTPGAMARLARGPIFERDHRLGNIKKLRSEPMASVELHFKEGKWLRDVPAGVSVLMDAKYQMTFLDYSQLWKGQRSTFLYVTVSDFEALMSVDLCERRPVEPGGPRPGPLVLDLDRPRTAIDFLLAELRRSVPFNVDDVDLVRTCIESNTGEELFTNLVGSERWRPDAVTAIPNMFLAGTYTRTVADVATIEGAVASGLVAAEHVRKRAGVQPPIVVKEPGYYHEGVFKVLKVMWAPWAFWAKVWSMTNDWVSSTGQNYLTTYANTWRTERNPGRRSPW